MKFDFHPTPRHLANLLVAQVKNPSPNTVADFSAGEGSLLLAAQDRWPTALKIATEIQNDFVGQIRSNFPKWHAGKCDFMSDASVRSCKALRNRKGSVDVILLNPPFSSSKNDRKSHKKGRPPTVAIEFLERAAKYGSAHSEICAILPASCLHNEKDRDVRDRIISQWNLHVVGHTGRRAFPDCSAESAIVHMTKRSSQLPDLALNESDSRTNVELVRGYVQMHLAKASRAASAVSLIHSTNLKSGTICGKIYKIKVSRYFEGPAVLLHRVGRPSPDKICILEEESKVALSDCVIAIPTKSTKIAEDLRKQLIENFNELSAIYIGTGAPFLTLDRLRSVISRVWR